jgi:WD40 repeat protein
MKILSKIVCLLILGLCLIGCSSNKETYPPSISISSTPSFTQTSTFTPTDTITPTITKSPSPIPSPTKFPIMINNAKTLVLLQTLGVRGDDVCFPISISPDFNYFASCTASNDITLWSVKTNSIIYSLNGHSKYVAGMAFSPDGNSLATFDDEGTMILWDPKTGNQIMKMSAYYKGIAWDGISFSPDGKRIITSSGHISFPYLLLWNLESKQTINVNSGSIANAFSPDNQYLITAGYALSLMDGKTGKFIRTFANYQLFVESIAFSPDGKILAANDTWQNITLWEFPSGKLINSFTPNSHAPQFDKNDRHIKLESDEWDGGPIAFSPDGKILATGFGCGSFILWDAATTQPIFVYKNMDWNFNGATHCDAFDRTIPEQLIFSKDGTMLAIVNADHSIKLWGIQ